MKKLKAEELKSDLKDLVETRLDAVQNKNVRIVFFKENDEWCANGICLQKDNTISERDIKTLGGIFLQLYKFMEQKIKTIFYNVNFLIISNFIPFKMCKK